MRVTAGGNKPLSAIGEAINQMLQSLAASQQELSNREEASRQALEELDQRVRERTQGLSDAKQALLAEVATHRHTAKALQQERDQAQRFLDTAGVLFVALDSSGQVVLINRKGCEILGYQESELLGRNWFETCLPAHNRHSVVHAFEQLLDGQLV
ncbi:MAG TPA: hypothetical protein DCE18_20585, partial [Syntrophobacteraceae bacterium]|nr:hypothetical protein [Syntrophobacteraceae bacterium]